MDKQFKIIAHRGNSSQAPENTRSSFIQAIDMNVDYVECDLQFTQDKVPVVIHDPFLSRITENKALHRVDVLNLEDIKSYDTGSWFHPDYSHERIMTFDEFLSLPRGQTGMMVEVKKETFTGCRTVPIVKRVLNTCACELSPLAPIIVGSICRKVLSYFEGHIPSERLIPIITEESHLRDFLPMKAAFYAICHKIAKKRIIHKLKDLGAEVWVWTVDNVHHARTYIHAGADGIITNHPKNMLILRNQMVNGYHLDHDSYSYDQTN